jgi:hypothetical protein
MKILIIFSFWFIALNAIGQKPFNYLYDFGFAQAGPRSIVELDDGYLVSGTSFVDTFTFRQVYFAKHKYNGEVVNVGLWKNNNVVSGLYDQGSNNVISRTNQKTSIVGLRAGPLGYCILEANDDLSDIDTLGCFIRFINDNFIGMVDQIMIDNIYSGLLTNPDITAGLQLVKVDFNNNSREFEFIDISPEKKYIYFFSEIKYMEDSDAYKVFGSYLLLGSNQDIIETGLVVLEVSNDFNLTKEVFLPLTITSGGETTNIIVDNQGNSIITTHEYIEVNEIDSRIHTRPTIIKLNANNEVVWQYFSPNDFRNYTDNFIDLVESNNKDGYIVIGQTYDFDVSLDNIPLISKISTNGELLWERKVFSFADKKSTLVQGLLKDKFGHYVVCGSNGGLTVNDTLDSFVQQWLFKFDDNGDVIYDGPSNVGELLNENIKIYPNPTAEIIYIDQQIDNKITYELHDLNGHLLESHLAKGNNVFLFDIIDYSSGTYVIRAIDANGQVLVIQKVVVE